MQNLSIDYSKKLQNLSTGHGKKLLTSEIISIKKNPAKRINRVMRKCNKI